MDIRQLRYFVHVAELQSFSRAAAKLNVAQSALSRHMRVLESELGVRLLHRHGRGAAPTAAGKILLKRAARLLRSLEETRHAVITVGKGPAGLVKLAVPPSVSQIFAAPLMDCCRASLPHVTLNLTEGWTGHILEWLISGRCDLGIIYSSQVDDQVTFRPIFSEDLELIVATRNRALAARPSITLDDVASMPLIVPPHPHGLRKVLESAFAERGLKPNFAYESEVWSVIREILESGVAQAIIPPSEVALGIREGRIVSVPIVQPVVRRTLGIAMARGREAPPAVDAVFDLVRRERASWPIPH